MKISTIAVASGKGGVGKTNISAGIAITLADYGHSVLVFDADLGLANLDVLLSLKPQSTLKHVIRDGLAIKEAIVSGPSGIDVVVGGSGFQELIGLEQEQLDELVSKVSSLARNYEYVIFDTAAGLDKDVKVFLLAADRTIVICTPDPTSIMDAYATIKTLFSVRPDADVTLLVNIADSLAQGQIVFNKLEAIVGQFLNKEITFAGCIVRDDKVIAATRARASFVEMFPKCHASLQIDEISLRVIEEKIQDDEEEEAISLLQRLRTAFETLKNRSKDDDEEESDSESDEEDSGRRRRDRDSERDDGERDTRISNRGPEDRAA